MSELVPIPSPGIALEFGAAGNPLVVVVHDWFGRLPALEFYAKALVRHGFRVVVPDLYGGVATTDEATAKALFDQLDVGLALAIVDDAVQGGRSEGSDRVALVGFSVGGWIALLHAQGGSADAVVAYYASLEPRDHGVIPCAVQLHLADADEWGEGQDPSSFIDRLRDHGTPISHYRYRGTNHGFANATIRATLDEQAAALAFARTATFLQEHLLE
ncbi:MAG: putative carboxymethylenebutenolidase [Microbacteriaceae bacterium]|jgi:carboxymethylenebutenolidase|nr:putative carboxymethylenebutenolidase [Microbacteriaceae bacterium]HEV7957787.1 alpha/beta fold hydrolase [Marisediminicola sp.]